MKAFLSHASKDKWFVEPLAKNLGRQFCVYDSHTFDTHEEFVLSVRRGLGESSVFALFASKNSLDSLWVSFEVHEAEYRLIQQHIKRFLVYLIDDSVSHSDLPEWMKRSLVKRAHSPKAAAREIRQEIESLIRDKRHSFFVGRLAEITEMQSGLFPPSGDPPPRLLVVHGLGGIGRRTLLDRTARDHLSYKRLLQIPVEGADTFRDLAVKLGLQYEVHADADSLRSWTERINGENESVATGAIRRAGRLASSAKELIVFVDAGGALDSRGGLTAVLEQTIATLLEDESAYCALVCRRRPVVSNSLSAISCSVRVSPLDDEDSRVLLSQIARRESVLARPGEMAQLVKQTAGYPPSAYYAVLLAKRYGVAALLADQEPLVSFRADFFLRELTSRMTLKPSERQVLSILAYYGPLPLEPLAQAARLAAESAARALVSTVDLALVELGVGGLYNVSSPIADAVRRVLPIEEVPHGRIAVALAAYLESCAPEDRRVELMRSLYRSKRWSGEDKGSDWAVEFASDILELAWESYHERKFERAIGFAQEVVDQQPENTRAREVLARALIREERFSEAEAELSLLREASKLREYYFLTGFMRRVRGEHSAAVEAYRKAIERGKRGVAVYREIALCCYAIGDLERTREYIAQAREVDASNRYVVDLEATVAIELKDEVGARRALRVLERIDDRPFFLHRRSTFLFAFGSRGEALRASQEAVKAAQRPTFALLAQLAKAEIAVGRLNDASRTLERLERSFPRVRNDIKIGLRCKWELAADHPENALALSAKFVRKDVEVQKALRRDAIEGAIAKGFVPADQLDRLARELEELKSELTGVVDPWPSADDDRMEDA